MDTENPQLITKNENFGTLMRTKGSHSNEGGVNAGFAVIDQPVLYMSEKVEEKITENVKNIIN
jgi:hypothetical protein